MQDAMFEAAGREHQMQQGIADTVKQLRVQKGASFAELSVLCGVHENSLRRLERGTGGINLGNFVRVCAALGKPAWKVLRHVERGPVQQIVGEEDLTTKSSVALS